MKLHLPCALRGALLACFALACTAPAWAADPTDVSLAGNPAKMDSYFIKTSNGTEYELAPTLPYTRGTLDVLSVKNDATIIISSLFANKNEPVAGEPGYPFTPETEGAGFVYNPRELPSLRIGDIQIAENANLTFRVKAGTALRLDNVNFTGSSKVNFILENGATLIISANDLGKGSISTEAGAKADVFITGGSINISGTSTYWATSSDPAYQSTVTPDEWQTYCSRFSASNADLTYILDKNVQVNLYNNSGYGGPAVGTSSNPESFPILYWGSTGNTLPNIDDNSFLMSLGAVKPTPDQESVVIDKEEEIYRENGSWNLHLADVETSVEDLKAGFHAIGQHKLGDVTGKPIWTTLSASDGIVFGGGILTTTTPGSTHTIGGAVSVTGTNKVILKPAANSTIVFEQGEGVINNGNGLVLTGAPGSTIALHRVSTTAPSKIEFATDNTTLAIAGPTNLTMDAANNKFLATSNLTKLDGGTLTYQARETDAIGSLNNTNGTVTIDKSGTTTAITLDVGALNAGTLNVNANSTVDVDNIAAGTVNITSEGSKVTAGSINAKDVNLSALTAAPTTPTLTATNLISTGTVTLGDMTKLNAANMNAGNVVVQSGATLSGTAIYVSGTTTVSTTQTAGGGIVVGGTSINSLYSNTSATLQGMVFNGTSLSATSTDNARITTTGTPTLSLGQVSNSQINTTPGTTIANTTLTSSSLFATDNLVLSGTTHGSNAHIAVSGTNPQATLAGGVIQVGDVRLVEGGATMTANAYIQVGGKKYTVNNATPNTPAGMTANSVTIVGTATADKMTIDALYADLTGENRKEPTAAQVETAANAPTLLTAPTGSSFTQGSSFFFDYITEPGMVPYLGFNGDKVSYIIKDESNKILQSLQTSGNVSPALEVLTEYGMDPGSSIAEKEELGEIFNYLRDTSRATQGRRQAAIDALVSGSITMLADSQRLSVVNTINKLRNRVIQMGNPQGTEPEHNIHAWISADGSSDDIDQDGAYAGYKYETWGGTVGANVDAGNFTFGAALSASYGELSSHATDHAEADHDVVSISGFVRHQHGPWTQMGILSLGRNETEMRRSIVAQKNPGKGDSLSYDGKGDASGHTITGYYEAGYTFTLGEEETQVIQPIVSLSLTSARMGEYSETGTLGNAAVCSDTEDYFYGTVGVGARYQIVLGSNVEGRLCFAEARAKVVQDFGDETNETTAFFSGLPGQSFTVKGADAGRTGFQFGAGISIPVGVYTTLFADADADIRSGSSSYSGSVGIRLEF